MPGKRIPDLTAIAGASTANDDNLVIYDTSESTTKRILRSQLAAGLVGDLPYTPSGGIAATTVPTAIAELDSEAAKSATLAASSGSSLVGFLQSGTGAVATTVQSKLRVSVSVKDFGAVGDGVTDDTAAIQAALNSGAKQLLLVNSGSTNFKITNSLTVPAGVEVVGVGSPTITAYFGSLKVAFILGAGSTIEGVSVVGGARTTAAVTLGVNQGYNYDPFVTAVQLNTNSKATKVHVVGCYLGFQSSEKQDVVLDDCSTFETGWGAVSFYHCGTVKINGGTFDKCGGFGGVMLPSCYDFAITNAYVYNKTGTGINPGGSDAVGYNVERGTVTNCTVEAGDCINFENGAVDCTVSGNIVTINSELGSSNGVGIGFLSGSGAVSNNTIVGNTVTSTTGGEGIKFGCSNVAQYVDRVNVAANTIQGVKIGIYMLSSVSPRDCRIFGNVISSNTGGIWINGEAIRLEASHNNITTNSATTIGNYYGVYILKSLTNSQIQDNVTTGWGTHYRQEATCTSTEIVNARSFKNEVDNASFTKFSSTVTPSINMRDDIRAFSANGVAGSYSFSPTANMGLIALDANVSFTPASNQSSSIWLYMNTVNGASTGYTTTGISVVKIAGLKHDYSTAITDCALVGSTGNDTITISAGGFNTFYIKEIPLN